MMKVAGVTQTKPRFTESGVFTTLRIVCLFPKKEATSTIDRGPGGVHKQVRGRFVNRCLCWYDSSELQGLLVNSW